MIGLHILRPRRDRIHQIGRNKRCPWHGWEFEHRYRESYCDHNESGAREYTVKCQNRVPPW